MMFDKKVKKNFGRIRFFLILSSSKSVFLLLSVEIGEDTQAFKGATLKVAFVPVSVGEGVAVGLAVVIVGLERTGIDVAIGEAAGTEAPAIVRTIILKGRDRRLCPHCCSLIGATNRCD